MDNFVLCQNDKTQGAEYNTFALGHESKFGYVCFVPSFDFVAHVAFDTVASYCELVGSSDEREVERYAKLELLNVGEQVFINDAFWLRLW